MIGLRITDVSKSYGQKRVVDSVSFSANTGEILGFLGPNGAGKTTTIRMIMGITAPDQGRIEFLDNNNPLPGIPQSSIGYLPEERGLYKEARVMRILVFLAGLKNVPKKVAKERALVWLDKFGLHDYANAKIEELSKGMAQKVQFIGSVLHQPKLIILDEPFSGLDPVSQDMFKTELRAMAAEGTTVILSSHQMNIMEELCDRIFLIHKGKEVFFGSLAEIKQKYGNYQVSITVEDNETLPKIASLPFIHASEYLHANKAVFTLNENVGLADFLSGIPPKLPILELNASRTSLHDIFVKIAIGAEDEK